MTTQDIEQLFRTLNNFEAVNIAVEDNKIIGHTALCALLYSDGKQKLKSGKRNLNPRKKDLILQIIILKP